MRVSITRRRIVVALVVLLAAGSLGGAVAIRAVKKGQEGRESDKGAPVTLEFAQADLAVVEPKPLSRWLPVSGTLQPVRQATVKAKVSGDVREITVRDGDPVTAGQLLVRVDTADLEAKLIERQGQLESARAQLALAQKTLSTNQKLLKQNFISQTAFDSSESNMNVTRGSVMSAEANVKLAQNAIKDALATAPLTGIVAKRHVQPGEKVAFDTPLVTVVDLKDIELQAMVPAVDIPELKPGMNVDLTVDGFGERRFTGRIERINPATEPGTRAILVFVGIPNPNSELRGGMFATGRVALAASAPVLSLPAAAVRTEGGQTYVWAIEDGKLGKRMVVVGRRDEETGRVEIKTALPAALKVLAARFDNLKEGAPALVKADETVPAKGSDTATRDRLGHGAS
ncbi:MAG TPA: efflux RND transporter periplasmic adaptor subunit [Casimicrobiaceae bacterium]|nr:efflux RND transporter periplasmic adaptor subunit [Casimicrobiaceae bacterium]